MADSSSRLVGGFERFKQLELHGALNLPSTSPLPRAPDEVLQTSLARHSRFRSLYREDKKGSVIELLHSGRPFNDALGN